MTSVEVAVARSQIADLRHRYCWAYDDGDLPTITSLFTEDAVVDLGDWGVFRGTAAIEAGFRGQLTPPGQPRTTLHTLSVPVLDIDGDTATGSWYVVVYHPPAPGDVHPIRFAGRYFDDYRDTGDGWRLSGIRLEQLWFAGY
jgi:ketosteroid isomerase-like protein